MKQVSIVMVDSDGNRIIVGEAGVDIRNGYVNVVGKIESEFLHKIKEANLKVISLGPFTKNPGREK